MLIYICCAGGMTSSLFVSKIKDAASENNVVVTDITTALANPTLEQDNDFVLAYGPIEIINSDRLDVLGERLDIVLICPQVRYFENKIKELLAPYHSYVASLDMKLFGTMNGKKAFAGIQEIIANLPPKNKE